MFPRGMNNKEKAGLQIIKDSGLAYEIKYNHSPYSGGYVANIPSLKETWSLRFVDAKCTNKLNNSKIQN